MLCSLLLTAMLASTEAAQTQTVPAHAAAAELARNGNYEDALVAFRQIAVRNPADHEARLWIARLHTWMGNPDLAEPVYRNLNMENRTNVEAIMGLADSLVQLDRPDEAIAVLQQAEPLAPQNPDVLAALGRAYSRAGDTTRSVDYYQRAYATAPTVDNRLSLERTRMVHGHRVELTGFLEDYTQGIPNARATDLAVNVRLSDRFRVFGRGQVQRKFSRTEERGGIGAEWRWRPVTTLSAHALVGPGNDVMPEVDANLQVDHVAREIQWVASLRYFDFTGAQVTVFSPGVTWFPLEKMSVGLRLAWAGTNFAGRASNETNFTGALTGSYLVYPRVWASLGYVRGVDNFETYTVDRVGDFAADTVSAGVRVDLPTLTTVLGRYEYQWRRNDVEMGRFTLSLAQRF
jgi:YaiO family outer membrane protein